MDSQTIQELQTIPPRFDGGCDESKCVSRGRSDIHNDSFTCYGGSSGHDDDGEDNEVGSEFPRMCADGFLPVVVEAEKDDSMVQEEGLEYFTCCPPWEGVDFDVFRRCSDPIPFEDRSGRVCSGFEDWKEPRWMNAPGDTPESIVCCTDPGFDALAAIDFLDETKCVPYRNDLYMPARVRNKIGKLDVVFCNLSDFPFARPLEGYEGLSSHGRYQCCKEGPSLPTFVHDTAFNVTVYTTIVLFAIAAVLSAIVGIGLLIPLLIELYTRRMEQRAKSTITATNSTTRFSVLNSSSDNPEKSRSSISHSRPTSSSSSSSNQQPSRQFRRASLRNGNRKKQPPRYSAYNLYLVYLAFIDFLFCSYSIWEYQRYINQTFDPSIYVTIAVSSPSMRDANTPRDEPTMAPYMIANMWINMIVCRQVLLLLRSSYFARRINQPSLLKVNLQAGGIFFVSLLAGVAFYFVLEPTWEARNNGDFEKYEALNSKIRPILFLFSIGIPLGYVLYATILIWWKGYLPKVTGATSPRNRAMRELALYFFRIVAVFIAVWLPRGIFIYIADYREDSEWADLVAQYVVAIQPILTTGLVLTKSDAKRYVRDLVTLKYLFGGDDPSCCGSNHCWPKRATTKKSNKIDRPEQGGRGGGGGGGETTSSIEIRFEKDDEEHEEEALDSLIFSVLGFRLNEALASGTSSTAGGGDKVENEASTATTNTHRNNEHGVVEKKATNDDNDDDSDGAKEEP